VVLLNCEEEIPIRLTPPVPQTEDTTSAASGGTIQPNWPLAD